MYALPLGRGLLGLVERVCSEGFILLLAISTFANIEQIPILAGREPGNIAVFGFFRHRILP